MTTPATGKDKLLRALEEHENGNIKGRNIFAHHDNRVIMMPRKTLTASDRNIFRAKARFVAKTLHLHVDLFDERMKDRNARRVTATFYNVHPGTLAKTRERE